MFTVKSSIMEVTLKMIKIDKKYFILYRNLDIIKIGILIFIEQIHVGRGLPVDMWTING